jgi:hypothetical protein
VVQRGDLLIQIWLTDKCWKVLFILNKWNNDNFIKWKLSLHCFLICCTCTSIKSYWVLIIYLRNFLAMKIDETFKTLKNFRHFFCSPNFYFKLRAGIPFSSLTLPHLSTCPKAGSGFLTSYVMVFFMFNDLRWEVLVYFVDISGNLHRFISPKKTT